MPNKRHKCNGTLADLHPPSLPAEEEQNGVKSSSNTDVDFKTRAVNGSPVVAPMHNTEVDKENQPVGVVSGSAAADKVTDKQGTGANSSETCDPSIGQ